MESSIRDWMLSSTATFLFFFPVKSFAQGDLNFYESHSTSELHRNSVQFKTGLPTHQDCFQKP